MSGPGANAQAQHGMAADAASSSSRGFMYESDAVVDLCDLVQNFTGSSAAQYRAVRDRFEDPTQNSEEVQEEMLEVLEEARQRLIRLLLHMHYAENGCYERGLHEIQMRSRIESNVAELLKCGESMAVMRETFSAALSRREYDIESASAMLSGCSLSNTGWPAMTEALILSANKPVVAWPLGPEEHESIMHTVMLEMLWKLTTSSCLKDPLRLKANLRSDGLHMIAEGAFSVCLMYDLHRWIVLEATTNAAQGYNFSLPECEEVFRQHLQASADAAMQDDKDVLETLFNMGHAFCAHLRLRLMHNNLLEIAQERPKELCRIKWDDSIAFRLLPEWDPSAGGLLQGHAGHTTDNDVHASFIEETMLQEHSRDQDEMEPSGQLPLGIQGTSDHLGCDVRLCKSTLGRIVVESRPDLGLQLLEPWVLEARGALFLEEFLCDLKQQIKLQHFQQIRAAYLEKGLFTDQDMSIDEVVPLLHVLLRGCPLWVRMDDIGRITVFADGRSEQEKVSLRLASGDLQLFEFVRWHACCGIVVEEARAYDWRPLIEWREMLRESSRSRMASSDDLRHHVSWMFGLADHCLEVCFELHDTEMTSATLSIVFNDIGGASASQRNVTSRFACPVEVPEEFRTSFSPTCFGTSASGHGFDLLREKVRQCFEAARKIADSLNFSLSVLRSWAEFGHSEQLAGVTESTVADQQEGECLAARITNDGLTCSFDWCHKRKEGKGMARLMPFAAPVNIFVDEHQQRWILSGKCRVDLQVFAAAVERIPGAGELLCSGGRLRVVGMLNLIHRLELEYSNLVNWEAWTEDLKAIALMLDVAQQAAEQDPGNHCHIEHRSLCHLRFHIPVQGIGTEIFKLSPNRLEAPAAIAHSVASAAKASSNIFPANCSFEWISPPTVLPLAPQLSQWICRSRDLLALLGSMPGTIELCRVVQELCDTARFVNNDDWVIDGLGATRIGVKCRSLLGVKIQWSSSGCVRIKQSGDLGTLPSFDDFMSMLSPVAEKVNRTGANDESHPKGALLRYEPGTLRMRLMPLWDYLYGYCVLLQLYLDERRHGQSGTEYGLRGIEIKAHQSSPRSSIVAVLQRTSSKLRFTWELQLVTQSQLPTDGQALAENSASKRRRCDVTVAKAKSSDVQQPHMRVFLRWQFFLAAAGSESQKHCLESADLAAEEMSHRQSSLERFTEFFETYLSSPASWRFHCLHPILGLLDAPEVWMLEDFSYMLPPLQIAFVDHVKSSAWQPKVEHFYFSGDLELRAGTENVTRHADWSQKLGDQFNRYVFGFVMEQCDGGTGCETLKIQCIRRSGREVPLSRADRQAGWHTIFINNKRLEDWAQVRLGHRLGIKPPYLLMHVVKLLIEALGKATT